MERQPGDSSVVKNNTYFEFYYVQLRQGKHHCGHRNLFGQTTAGTASEKYDRGEMANEKQPERSEIERKEL